LPTKKLGGMTGGIITTMDSHREQPINVDLSLRLNATGINCINNGNSSTINQDLKSLIT